MFRCNVCNKMFSTAKFYEEKHNLDTPPYERIAVCPMCDKTDFYEYEPYIEKSEVAEKLLIVMAALNRYWADVSDVFGEGCRNENFDNGISTLNEFINELIPFLSVESEKMILKMRTENDIEKIMLNLRG